MPSLGRRWPDPGVGCPILRVLCEGWECTNLRAGLNWTVHARTSLKQPTSRKLNRPDEAQFWQRRYYDFNVWNPEKTTEKLRYMHRNPVKRGLVARPEDWKWSSFRHYATGLDGTLEIESEWTARRREQREFVPSHP